MTSSDDRSHLPPPPAPPVEPPPPPSPPPAWLWPAVIFGPGVVAACMIWMLSSGDPEGECGLACEGGPASMLIVPIIVLAAVFATIVGFALVASRSERSGR